MACNKPIPVWSIRGEISFTPEKSGDHYTMEIPCGKCTQCRLDHSRERTIRCINEASMYENNSFVTLTISDENMPKDKSLDYEMFKTFMKKLRWHESQKGNKLKYFVCGEYGGELKNKDNTWIWDRSTYQDHKKPKYPRAHFHALIFNYWPDDADILYMNHMQQEVYTSKKLQKIWGNGHVSFGEVTTMSCGYVARYVMKKQNTNEKTGFIAKYNQPLIDKETGELICIHPEKPEFAFGSTQPAIGAKWLEQYWNTDCFNQGYLLGPEPEYKKYTIPRYYWEWLEKNHNKEYKEYKKLKSEQFLLNKDKIEADNTFIRQESKDFITIEKTNKLLRSL